MMRRADPAAETPGPATQRHKCGDVEPPRAGRAGGPLGGPPAALAVFASFIAPFLRCQE